MTRDEVVEAIHEAFSNTEIPRAGELINDEYVNEDAKKERWAGEIRSAFTGKRWQDLSDESLYIHQISRWYLSDSAWAYYLPGYLITTLRGLPEEDQAVFMYLGSLQPSYRAIYYQGHDAALEKLQSHLTENQRRAVVQFLNFMFEESTQFRCMASHALRYGWKGVDAAADKTIETYYHEIGHYTYPEPENPEAAELSRRIREAFEDTQYPSDNNLIDGSQDYDGCTCALGLRGVTWQTAGPELLNVSRKGIEHLSASAFRYFVPAFMIADLCGLGKDVTYQLSFPVCDLLDDALVNDALERSGHKAELEDLVERAGLNIGELIGKFQKEMQARKEASAVGPTGPKQYSLFNQAQRLVIIDYLRFRTDPADEASVRQAIVRYWQPSVGDTES